MKFKVIAREDKGAIGIDYNRSPTIFFKTRGGEGNESADDEGGGGDDEKDEDKDTGR